MNYDALIAELDTDPLVRGYATMTDEEAAADLHTAYRKTDRQTMTGSQVLNAIVASEYNDLTEAQRGELWQLLGLGTLNPFGREADVIARLFGSASDTVAALQSARKRSITRAVELKLHGLKAGHIRRARAKMAGQVEPMRARRARKEAARKAEAARLLSDGMTTDAIAARFGVSEERILKWTGG